MRDTGGRMEKRRHVIVAGAGPVGMVTALGLARAGIPVTVIEAESKINDSPRAAVYLPVTLELLERIGIIDDAHKAGVYNDWLCIRYPEIDDPIRLSPNVLQGRIRHPYQLHFGQDVLAHMVMRRLLELPGTEVRFNARVAGVEQDSSGVNVTVETAEGPAMLRCDWLVGCDGGRSTVRKLLGLDFEGHTWPERFVANNIWYDEFLDHGFERANFWCDYDRWAVFAIIDKQNLWRVTYNEDGDISDDEALRRIPERLASLLPGSGKYRIAASSPYRVHERAATRFRVGRVLLAGDAAHVCNPCGGMGLTTGLMDANALMDALGAVINGTENESLLDFYAEDRRRVFLEFSSPAATEYKRILEEQDPERRRKDIESFRQVAADPELMCKTMLAIFTVRGEPMLRKSGSDDDLSRSRQ
jgi:2-polyprenyl-6-methoxyphenol hydroxylase-like FAD-dependent oxidoreductase